MNGLRHRDDIQGIRAVAVVLVLLSHFGSSTFKGGFVGVDVFFVISGYLITAMLWYELQRDGRIRLAEFYARRLRRLMPALVVMIATTLAAALLLLSSFEIREQTGSLPYALTWTSNLFFAFTHTDYFAWLRHRDLYLHTWSLGVEEQFYLLWPLLLWALFRGTKRESRRCFALLLLLCLSLAGCVLVSATENRWAFYLPLFRIWQFGLGALVFHFGRRPAAMGRVASGLSALAGLGLILGSALYLERGVGYPGGWALLPSVGAALVIVSGTVTPAPLLTSPAAVWIGDRSYSLYLWHWPVLVLGMAWGLHETVPGLAGLALLSLLLAQGSYRLIELPFWKGRSSRSGSAEAVLATAAGTMALAVLGLTLAAVAGSAFKAQHDVEILAARGDVPLFYFMGCDHWYHDSELTPCELGRRDQAGKDLPTVVLLGDSIGAQWAPMLPVLFPRARHLVLVKSSCPIVDAPVYNGHIGAGYTVCSRWREKALTYLESLRPAVTLIGSASTYGYSDEQWREGSRRILRRLAPVSGEVIVIAGTPRLGFDGPGCLARLGAHPRLAERLCSSPLDHDPRISRVSTLLGQAVAGLSRVHLLDPAAMVCPDRICRARSREGDVVFHDNQHLTKSFVRKLARHSLRHHITAMLSTPRLLGYRMDDAAGG